MTASRWLMGIAGGLVVVLGAVLRLHDLGSRPMHADEANQAVKLGALLEHGDYRFDPQDHHGPTLYYFAAVTAWVRGERRLAELTEETVRLTPALAGTASVLLLACVLMPLGRGLAWAAALLLAVAPAAVYYSRYFVQETLLLTFFLGTLLATIRWRRSGRLGWAIAAGAGLGLMQATKATAPVFVGCAWLAWWAARGTWLRGEAASDTTSPRGTSRGAVGLALITALGVAALFYSSFLTHGQGLRDAVATYLPMSGRAAGTVGGHDKPWWYYCALFWRQTQGGYVWDQSLFAVLVGVGAVGSGWSRSRGWRALAIYGVGLSVVLSAVPYKTPWIVIHLLPAFCALAAWLPLRAAGLLARAVDGAQFPTTPAWIPRLRSGIAVGCVAVVVVWQAQQVRQAVFRRPADPRNPFAYVHSSPDVTRVTRLAEQAGSGPIRVISEEYWPLPWYLRFREDVGYWATAPADCDGALVLVSPAMAEVVRERLRGRYEEGYLGLRPGFVLLVFRRVAEAPGTVQE